MMALSSKMYGGVDISAIIIMILCHSVEGLFGPCEHVPLDYILYESLSALSASPHPRT